MLTVDQLKKFYLHASEEDKIGISCEECCLCGDTKWGDRYTLIGTPRKPDENGNETPVELGVVCYDDFLDN